MDNKVHYHITAGVEDPMQHGRGVALADFNRDGKTDIVYGNWNGPHRLYIQLNNRKQKFKVSSDFSQLYMHTNTLHEQSIFDLFQRLTEKNVSSHLQKA